MALTTATAARLIRLRIPRRPPVVVALDQDWTVQLSLTTDLGDPYWPEDTREIPLNATVLDSAHRIVPDYVVDLRPSSLLETGAIFHTFTVSIHCASRRGKGHEGVYLAIGPAGSKEPVDSVTKQLLGFQVDCQLVQPNLAIMQAVAGPLTIAKVKASSKERVEMTELLFRLDHEELTLRERPEHGLGSHVWDASIVLASYLLHLPEPLYDCPFDVLELGAGTGLASFACLSRHHVAQAHLTDLGDVIEQSTRPAIDRAPISLRQRADAGILEWVESPLLPEWLLADRTKPLLIMAADVVYNSSIALALAQTLSACLRSRPIASGLLSYRPRPDTACFFTALEHTGISAEAIHGASYDDVTVYACRLKNA